MLPLTPEERRLFSQLMRKVVSMRRRRKGICPICGRDWEGYVNKVYCSHRCANVAWYRRHREEVLERRRRRRSDG